MKTLFRSYRHEVDEELALFWDNLFKPLLKLVCSVFVIGVCLWSVGVLWWVLGILFASAVAVLVWLWLMHALRRSPVKDWE